MLAALAAVTDRLGPDRHDQLHLQRALRGGPPVRQPRPPLRRPGRLERGHLLGRLHRRELPPRRLPAPGRALRRAPRSSCARPGSCSTPGTATRSSPTRHRASFLRGSRRRARSPTTASTSTSPAGSTCRAARRAARSSSRPATPTRAASSPPPTADAIFSRHATLEAGQAFYADVKGRLARYGRSPDELLILPGRDVRPRRHRRRGRRSGPRGPPPAGQRADRDQVPRAGVEPRPVRLRPRRAAARRRPGGRREHDLQGPGQRAACTATRSPSPTSGASWPTAKNLSIRDLVIEVTGRQSFIGTPATVAAHHQPVRPGRRQRRLHPRPAHHAGRPRRLRRQGRARCCRSGACSAPTTRARPCATTSASHRLPPGGLTAPNRRLVMSVRALKTRQGARHQRGSRCRCSTWSPSWPARLPVKPSATRSRWPRRPRPRDTTDTGSPSTTSTRGWPGRTRRS